MRKFVKHAQIKKWVDENNGVLISTALLSAARLGGRPTMPPTIIREDRRYEPPIKTWLTPEEQNDLFNYMYNREWRATQQPINTEHYKIKL